MGSNCKKVLTAKMTVTRIQIFRMRTKAGRPPWRWAGRLRTQVDFTGAAYVLGQTARGGPLSRVMQESLIFYRMSPCAEIVPIDLLNVPALAQTSLFGDSAESPSLTVRSKPLVQVT